jgi:AraC family transcriptional regulator, transcriptional activator of pobA
MEDKGFISFSLESLGKMNLLSQKDYHIYHGCSFIRIDSNLDKKIEMFRYPCRIKAYIAMLCIEGSVEIISNLKHYIIEKNCLFITMPKDIIQLCEWNGSKLYVAAFDDDFTHTTNMSYSNVHSVFIGIQKHPCLKILQHEATCLEDTFLSMERDTDEFEEGEYYNEIVMSYLNLITYKACSFISRYLEAQSEDVKPVNKRGEEYFDKFMSLLTQHSRYEHGIGFYASKLCITPKYMTSLIKKTSGKSAMEWINDCIIMEAKNLLRYSNMNIQEISEHLNFSNQSFFAQYFKRFTGCSPSVYRGRPQQHN